MFRKCLHTVTRKEIPVTILLHPVTGKEEKKEVLLAKFASHVPQSCNDVYKVRRIITTLVGQETHMVKRTFLAEAFSDGCCIGARKLEPGDHLVPVVFDADHECMFSHRHLKPGVSL
jgi:hypothetical protein